MFNILKTFSALIFLIGFFAVTTSCNKPNDGDPPILPTDSNLYVLQGKLVYHSYSCYSCNDSKLYLYDFGTKKLTILSTVWKITNPMNAHFSPDGKKIVFMGIPSGPDNWDVFMFEPGSLVPPVNLTSNSPGRDEDPKFSPDGTKIIFKRNGILKEMDTTGLILNTFTVPQSEASMPYYTADGNGLLYAGNEPGGSTLDIFLLSTTDGTTRALSTTPKVEEYYPITKDDTSFLFTRWNSPYNDNDQVYLGFFDGRPSVRLPFNQTNNNFSDAFPVDGHTVVLSSTMSGGKGAYDLYLADTKTGETWSLNLYNPYINTANNELGACYSSK